MSALLSLAILIYGVDAVFFGLLAYVYGRTAISTRAGYALGLFIFSILLLAQDIGTAAAYLFLGQYFGDEALPFMAVMGSFELVAVLTLLRVTL